MAYVYIRSEPGLWTVGFYQPDGKWQPESDHDSADEAARRDGQVCSSVDLGVIAVMLDSADDARAPAARFARAAADIEALEAQHAEAEGNRNG